MNYVAHSVILIILLRSLIVCQGSVTLSISHGGNTQRVVGDRPASEEIRSYLALLINLDQSILCAGTLVAPIWILTSGYCIFQNSSYVSNIQVIFNADDLDCKRDVHAKVIEGMPILHPYFQMKQYNFFVHNVGLLKLQERAPFFTNFVRLSNHKITDGDCVVSAGWGVNSVSFDAVLGKLDLVFNRRSLFEEDQNIIDLQECRYIFGNRASEFGCMCKICELCKLTKSPTIAGGGGPLLCNGKQVGITPPHPYKILINNYEKFSVWTRIACYMEWIECVINNKEYVVCICAEDSEDNNQFECSKMDNLFIS